MPNSLTTFVEMYRGPDHDKFILKIYFKKFFEVIEKLIIDLNIITNQACVS